LQESSQTKCRSLDAELKAALEKISKLEKELVAFKNETANSISSLEAELVTFHKNIDEIEKELVAYKSW
jgi:U3 small nucleolar ribonucleoprotein component